MVKTIDTDNSHKKRRIALVAELKAMGIKDTRVLKAIAEVPRHLLISEEYKENAYGNYPLPIDYGQTISQPYIVAYMSEAADISAGDRVLEIGTGSGYQAAILAKLCKEVYSIEIIKPLALNASKVLKEIGYTNVIIKSGDGYNGWQEYAPFDIIILTAAPEKIPQPLLKQLKISGIMIMPIGGAEQKIIRIKRNSNGFTEEPLLPCRFVPMTGKVSGINIF